MQIEERGPEWMQGTGVLSKKVAQQTMRAVCYGWNPKCPQEAPVFEHAVPRCSVGRSWDLWDLRALWCK